MTKFIISMLCVTALLATSACTGASQRKAARSETKANEAQEEVAKERLALIEEYKKCVADAGNDLLAVEACDVYLKSAEALG